MTVSDPDTQAWKELDVRAVSWVRLRGKIILVNHIQTKIEIFVNVICNGNEKRKGTSVFNDFLVC